MSICAQPNCPRIATDHGRCTEHRKLVTGTGARGSTRQWRKLRAQCLQRDGNRCTYEANGVRCPSTSNLEAHHLVAKRDGGEDELSNLATRCRPHH